MKTRYTITARRTNGESMNYCLSDTQGSRMVPNALSMAYVFESQDQAKKAIREIAIMWPGLVHWKVIKFND